MSRISAKILGGSVLITALLGASLLTVPAMANNGRGIGAVNGNANTPAEANKLREAFRNAEHSKAGLGPQNIGTGLMASAYGAFNAFFHASANGQAHANPTNSITGRINAYIATVNADPNLTEQIAEALAKVTKRPLTFDQLTLINDGLYVYNAGSAFETLDNSAILESYTSFAPQGQANAQVIKASAPAVNPARGTGLEQSMTDTPCVPAAPMSSGSFQKVDIQPQDAACFAAPSAAAL